MRDRLSTSASVMTIGWLTWAPRVGAGGAGQHSTVSMIAVAIVTLAILIAAFCLLLWLDS
jgi:hypothetical protein